MGILPGVRELPVRKQLPDVMTMNDGKKVGTRKLWRKRREEMKRILEYYAVGQMPPPPGNVKGKEILRGPPSRLQNMSLPPNSDFSF